MKSFIIDHRNKLFCCVLIVNILPAISTGAVDSMCDMTVNEMASMCELFIPVTYFVNL